MASADNNSMPAKDTLMQVEDIRSPVKDNIAIVKDYRVPVQ